MGAAVAFRAARDFSELTCGECGIVFAIETHLRDKWVDTKHSFYCPNGHSRRFTGEAEADRVRREMSEQLASAHRALEWERVRTSNALKQASAIKGQMTKLRKRVGNGVCPCCHRTFSQLSRHMTSQHPEYATGADEATGSANS